MTTPVVVSDTSPLQYLHQAGVLDLLPSLFSEVVVPPAVVGELAEGRARGHDLPNPDTLAWMHIRSPQTSLVLPAKLGRGEQEAISMAAELRVPVLMDDRDARTCARSVGLTIFGTFGILLRAKQQHVLPAVMPVVEHIVAQGFRLDPRIRDEVRRLAGE